MSELLVKSGWAILAYHQKHLYMLFGDGLIVTAEPVRWTFSGVFLTCCSPNGMRQGNIPYTRPEIHTPTEAI